MGILKWQIQEKNKLNDIINRLCLADIKIELSSDVIENERILQDSVNEIRTLWLIKNAKMTSKFNFSPWRGQQPKDYQGNNIFYTYGTLTNDSEIAKQFERQPIIDRMQKTFLYNNGMSAIRGTLEIINSFISEGLSINSSVGYFETRILLETLGNCGIKVNREEDYNVFVYEPIRYLVNLEVSDLDNLIYLINNSSAKVKFVIIDSTMHCTTQIFEFMDRMLVNSSNVIYIDVRSGIKQDQYGLELANLGVATWYVREVNKNYADLLFKYIKNYKDITGDNISYNKLMVISKCSYRESKEYEKNIHKIAYDFYKNINILSHRYIEKVLYPTLEIESEVLSMPFIFIKFTLESSKEYEVLLDNIIDVCYERKLFLPYRNSFGFRFPSIEFICDFHTKECTMKLCLGCYKGVLYETLLEIINELACEQDSVLKQKLVKQIKKWEYCKR